MKKMEKKKLLDPTLTCVPNYTMTFSAGVSGRRVKVLDSQIEVRAHVNLKYGCPLISNE